MASIVSVLIAMLVAGVVALIVAVNAHRRIADLRQQLFVLAARLARLEAAQGGVPAAPATPVSVAPREASWPLPASAPPPLPSAPPPARDLESLVGAQWLTWLGVFGVFLGTSFFVAVDLGRSPLAGVFQVLAGLVVGAGFVVVGRRLTGPTHGVLGQGLLGAGIALLFLAAYGAYGFHRLVAAPVVYPFLLGVAVTGAVLALRRDSYGVALLTAGGALLAPGLLRAPGDPAAALFPYLLAVNLGGAIVAARRPWRWVTPALFAGSVFILAEWWTEHFAPAMRWPALSICASLWLLYSLLPFLAWRGAPLRAEARSLVVTGAGLLFAVVLHAWLAPELTALRGVALALLALALVGGARLATRRGCAGHAATLMHHTGLAVAVIAVPVQFDLGWVTLAWSLLGLILVAGGLRFDSPAHRLAGLLVDVLAVVRVLVPDSLASFERGGSYALFWNLPFVAGLSAVVVLGLTARLMLRRRDRLAGWERKLPATLIIGASLLLLWRISIESTAWYDARAEALRVSMKRPSLLVLSLIWAVYAALLILAGFLARYRPIRLLGVAVLGLLVLKMLLLDLQVLEAGYRIASFLGVGVVLLAISVLYQRERRT